LRVPLDRRRRTVTSKWRATRDISPTDLLGRHFDVGFSWPIALILAIVVLAFLVAARKRPEAATQVQGPSRLMFELIP